MHVCHGSGWHSADLWWCFFPSCPHPMLIFPGLTPPNTTKRKKSFESPFTSVSIFPGNFCFHTVKRQKCGLTWPLVTDFSSQVKQSFDLVLGNYCSSANPPVSSVLLPGHHLIFFKYCSPSRRPFATSSLWVSRVPCPCFSCSRLCLLCSAVSTPSLSLSSMPPFFF